MKIWNVLALVMMLTIILACNFISAPLKPDTPKNSVEQVFQAYLDGKPDKVTDWMSDEGKTLAVMFCDKALAIECLVSNYQGKGEIKSFFSTLKEMKSAESASVILHTKWSNLEEELCQQYELVKSDEGWRVAYFDSPTTCTQP